MKQVKLTAATVELPETSTEIADVLDTDSELRAKVLFTVQRHEIQRAMQAAMSHALWELRHPQCTICGNGRLGSPTGKCTNCHQYPTR